MSTAQATRCPNCATVFRVAAEQLQAYEGWVRCGRCAEVFNAEACLVELDPAPPSIYVAAPPAASPAPPARSTDTDFELDMGGPPPSAGPTAPPAPRVRGASGLAPAYGEDDMVERAVKAMRAAPMPSPMPAADSPAWPRPAPPQPPVEADFAPQSTPPSLPRHADPMPHAEVRPEPQGLDPHTQEPTAVSEAFGRIEPTLDGPHAARETAGQPDGDLVAPTLSSGLTQEPAHPDFDTAARWRPDGEPAVEPDMLSRTAHDDDATAREHGDLPAFAENLQDEPVPSFVRKADRAARWRSPRARWATAGVCLLAALALVLQAAYEYRDQLAARFEVTRPLLQTGCQWIGCTVSAPRALDAEGVTVESSGLVRVEKTNTYTLTVALRNRAATPVTLPALELTLTDAQGKLMARRVLRAADFGVTQTTVAAGRDVNLQASMQTAFATVNNEAQEVVAGYTIELFYP